MLRELDILILNVNLYPYCSPDININAENIMNLDTRDTNIKKMKRRGSLGNYLNLEYVKISFNLVRQFNSLTDTDLYWFSLSVLLIDIYSKELKI